MFGYALIAIGVALETVLLINREKEHEAELNKMERRHEEEIDKIKQRYYTKGYNKGLYENVIHASKMKLFDDFMSGND